MKTRILAALAAALAAASAVAVLAAAPLEREQLERRLAAVETLIERSSAARQIEASPVAAAAVHRERARALHRDASSAFASGDLARAAALLPQASVEMFEAVRLAAPEQVAKAHDRSELEARLDSARSLLAAQRRIATEKQAKDGARTTRDIEQLIRTAEEQSAVGSIEAAQASAERAYLLAKAAIGTMRGGDTLVRSLSFATKEEEYAYELDRNDTHRMLLKMLLDARRADAAAAAAERSARLRADAEKSAGAGDPGGGIALLEQSTRELVRAIRAAGVYIPD